MNKVIDLDNVINRLETEINDLYWDIKYMPVENVNNDINNNLSTFIEEDTNNKDKDNNKNIKIVNVNNTEKKLIIDKI